MEKDFTELQNQILKVVEVSCPNEFVWKKARSQILRITNDFKRKFISPAEKKPTEFLTKKGETWDYKKYQDENPEVPWTS